MRSVRLNDELDKRVRRAAATEGSSVSEFMRKAIAERVDRTLADGAEQRLADVIGAVHTDGQRARQTGTEFAKLLSKRHRHG